jgi:hypothetical protein
MKTNTQGNIHTYTHTHTHTHTPASRAFASPFLTCPLAAFKRSGSITENEEEEKVSHSKGKRREGRGGKKNK